MGFPVINPGLQFFDSAGNPLEGGLLYSYEAGTSTGKTTYSDAGLTTPNANPVVLDSAGRCSVFLVDGAEYKFILKNAAGVTQWTRDDVKSPESLTAAAIGAALYPQTAAEIAAGVTPTDYAYEPGDVRRNGAVGDGVTDDTNALKNTIASSSGKTIHFGQGLTYLVQDTLTLEENTEVNLHGSELRFNVTGQKRLLDTASGCVVHNGTVRNITSDVTNYGAEWQQPICVGHSNSITRELKNVHIKNLTMSSTSPGSNILFAFGTAENVLFEDIVIEGGSGPGEVIGVHWAVEPGGDETQGTAHPNNITFRRITIGEMTYSSGEAAIYLSALGNVTIEDVSIENYVANEAIFIYAGDHGYTYALNPELQKFGPRVRISNVFGKALSGVNIEFRDTDTSTVWPSDIVLENVDLFGNSPTNSSSRGLDIGGCDGVDIRNSKFDTFFNSQFLRTQVTNPTFENVQFKNSNKNGCDADNSAGCANLRFKRCKFVNSNTAGGTGYDLIFGSYIDGIDLEEVIYNSPSVTFNANFLSAEPPRNVRVRRNRIEATGGTSFVFGSSASFGICEEFVNNTQAETVTANLRGGQILVPFSQTIATSSTLPIRRYYGAQTAPTVGTFNPGDTILDDTPSASGKVGLVCEVGGTQGTYSEGLTATTDGTTAVVLSAASNVLRRGMYITINSTDVRIVSLNGTAMVVSATIASASGQAIAYKAGTFKLFGVIDA